jgi:hypothetical protein
MPQPRPRFAQEGTAFVAVNSHRASSNLASLLAYKPKCFFNFDRPGKYLYEIPADKLAQARKLKGVTKARITEGYQPCF